MVLDAQVEHAVDPRLADDVPFTTTIAADWRPRMSPPAFSAASSACSIRSARSPSAASNASAIAGQMRRVGHEIGLHGERAAHVLARVRDALGAGVRGDVALGVHHRHLPDVGGVVHRDQRVQRLPRRHARCASGPARAVRSPPAPATAWPRRRRRPRPRARSGRRRSSATGRRRPSRRCCGSRATMEYVWASDIGVGGATRSDATRAGGTTSSSGSIRDATIQPSGVSDAAG